MKSKKHNTGIRRRSVMGGMAALGGGMLFRALASGVPLKVLLDPLSASAEELAGPVLILVSSAKGDPFNCNVPGTYIDDGENHPDGLTRASLELPLGGAADAASVWCPKDDAPTDGQRFFSKAQLDRSLFFHHASGTPVHGDMDRVQRMLESTDNNDMLLSLIAAALAQKHTGTGGYIQSDPVSIGARAGSELLMAGGRRISNASPQAVRQALLGVSAGFNNAAVRSARDEVLMELESIYKKSGTPGQRDLVGAWAESRSRLRGLDPELAGGLSDVTGGGEDDQVKTAAVLAKMRLAPVVTMHLDFGGDNHGDPGFAIETDRHLGADGEVGGVEQLANLLELLKPSGSEVPHDTYVGVLNVFGRTFGTDGGRNHNRNHNVLYLNGPNIKGGVVGGLEKDPDGPDYRAKSINADSGAGVDGDGGDVKIGDSLVSAGKTLAYAMGLDETTVHGMFNADQKDIPIIKAAVTDG